MCLYIKDICMSKAIWVKIITLVQIQICWINCLNFLPINSPSRNNIRNMKKMDERKADLTGLEGYVTTVASKYPEKGKGEFGHVYCCLGVKSMLALQMHRQIHQMVAVVVQASAALHLKEQDFAACSPKAAHPQCAACAVWTCQSNLPLPQRFVLHSVWTGPKPC